MFPIPRISCASLPSAGEGTHKPRMPSEDLRTSHFKHETDFKHRVLVDESDHHSFKPLLPKITVLSFILKWVANYGLKKLNMEISRYMGPSCTHQKSVQGLVSAKYCSVLPSIEINVSCGFCCSFPFSHPLPVTSHKWATVLGGAPCACLGHGLSSCFYPQSGMALGKGKMRIPLEEESTRGGPNPTPQS